MDENIRLRDRTAARIVEPPPHQPVEMIVLVKQFPLFHQAVVLQHNAGQPVTVVPNILGPVIVRRRTRNPRPRQAIPLIVVSITENPVACQAVVRAHCEVIRAVNPLSNCQIPNTINFVKFYLLGSDLSSGASSDFSPKSKSESGDFRSDEIGWTTSDEMLRVGSNEITELQVKKRTQETPQLTKISWNSLSPW